MTFDEAIERVLDDAPKHPQCKTCRLVRDTDMTDDRLTGYFDTIGAPKLAAALRLHYGDGPSPDAIRKHLANHVA